MKTSASLQLYVIQNPSEAGILTQSHSHKMYADHAFLAVCLSFFAPLGEKITTKEEKYHTAAGYI
jgi:hypothetical protein